MEYLQRLRLYKQLIPGGNQAAIFRIAQPDHTEGDIDGTTIRDLNAHPYDTSSSYR